MKHSIFFRAILRRSIIVPLFSSFFIQAGGYSKFRKRDPLEPTIEVSWKGDSKKYHYRDSHFEEHPIFSFNAADCMPYVLPNTGTITPQNAANPSDAQEINQRILDVVAEIQNNKRTFNHFTILQDKNFNYKSKVGLIVLKFKDHPFVLKLFCEKPETFLDKFAKGIESYVFAYMAGGSNRHVLGLSRIKNRNYTLSKLNEMEKWKGKIIIPRKWFWVHPTQPWLQVDGAHIGNKEKISTSIPATYAIVADAIDTNQHNNIPSLEQRKIIMQLCNDLDFYLDPHRPNYVLNTDAQNNLTISIIDTEHFPSCVGLKKKLNASNYITWYIKLTYKCLHDVFGRNKKERRHAQGVPYSLNLA